MTRKLKYFFTYILAVSFMFIGFTQSTHAALIGTEQLASANAAQQHRAHIGATLNRPEIQAEFEKLGINKSDAEARIAALTDEEAASLADKIDTLPAGGNDIVGALLVIFVILLVTDLLGLTHIFPFTRSSTRR